MDQTRFKSAIILVDADYADAVAGAMLGQIAREQNRPVVQADLADWIVAVAGEDIHEETQVVFVHSKGMKSFRNFLPEKLSDIDGQAFMDDAAGEFLLSCVPDDSPETTSAFYAQCAEAILSAEEVKDAVLVANMDEYGELLNQVVKDSHKKVRIVNW